MTEDPGKEKKRLAKVFSDAGVRLGAIDGDFHGLAARKMAECLINGGTPRQALAAAAGWHRLHASDQDILQSLENDLNDVHRALLHKIPWPIYGNWKITSIGWAIS
jgi:hypothetical protein